jgi:hypothetical protein
MQEEGQETVCSAERAWLGEVFLPQLGLGREKMSDPRLIKDILTRDMMLEDLIAVRILMADLVATPQPLSCWLFYAKRCSAS